MRAIVQRVDFAKVEVEDKIVGSIDQGLLVLLGVGEEDTEKDLDYMVDKILGLRVFQGENDKMNLSLEDIGGEILVVSQFTLYGDVRKGRRPSFSSSADPKIANELYRKFIDKCLQRQIKTQCGIFGADMNVSLLNQGPVTIMVDSKKTF